GAVEELGVSASSEIDMPYFASSAQGPIHFRRELTVADIRILAGDVPAEPPAPKPAHRPRELQAAPLNAGSAEEPAAPPKRWWWPF
ncbi:MAG: hypothetical protein OEY14_07675, partial [Myxococcales bacterium]|nr:hypothetical protein [Myxococcales bacterium]